MKSAAITSTILIGFLFLVPISSAYAENLRFAVVIGNNRGHDSQEKLRYAERDARKIYEVLTELGGFLEDNVELLLGTDASQVWNTIHRMEKRLVGYQRHPGTKTLLVLYYSGHAEGDELELGKSSLKYDELMDYLRTSKADVRLAFLDSCLSGKLIAAKGGHRGPGFDIQVRDEITAEGYAVITSSAQDELSQESSEIRGAFFTHYLVSALRGAGDRSGDGKVTLNEAYQYTYQRTLARTSATFSGSQHPMYEFELRGMGEIILTQTAASDSRIAVKVQEPGRLILLDESGNSIVAETDISEAKTAVFGVRSGSYFVYLITSDAQVRIAQVHVEAGKQVVLRRDGFQTVALESAVSKGGLFSESDRDWLHRLGVGGLWRLWPLEGAVNAYGLNVIYRAESPDSWEPVVKLTWSSRPDVGLSRGYHDIGLLVGVGYLYYLSRFALRVELLAGYEHILQEKWKGQERHTSGFDYLGVVGLELPTSGLFTSIDFGAGGRVFQIIDKGWVHRFDMQAILTLGWMWGRG